jgi:hypothetical protein
MVGRLAQAQSVAENHFYQMNKSVFGVVALALATAACQPQTSSKAAKDTVAAPVAARAEPAPARPAPAGAAPMPLPQIDLSEAWSNASANAEARHHLVMEGFYGPEHYRISFFFSKVRRDSLHPEVYHIWGKNRYKKVITPFEGTVTVGRFAALPDTVGMENSRQLRAYTAFAEYTLREDPTTKGAGVYSGRALLDFTVNNRNEARQANFMTIESIPANPTKGSGLLFQGTWRDNRTGRMQPAAWSSNFLVIVPKALEKIGLGSRADTVFPELAKYGWNEWYENDEWWADSPKPRLSL